jgi:hypothetical protein
LEWVTPSGRVTTPVRIAALACQVGQRLIDLIMRATEVTASLLQINGLKVLFTTFHNPLHSLASVCG